MGAGRVTDGLVQTAAIPIDRRGEIGSNWSSAAVGRWQPPPVASSAVDRRTQMRDGLGTVSLPCVGERRGTTAAATPGPPPLLCENPGTGLF